MVESKRIAQLTTVAALLAAGVPLCMAQSCIPLDRSTQCPGFNFSSVSTGSALSAAFPFLAFVSNIQQFDTQLSQYINTSYVQTRYQQLLGCDNVNLTNTTDYYARYTTSVVCNAIIQNSIGPCALRGNAIKPLCAETCAQQATSEEGISMDSKLCTKPRQGFLDQIRADFTNCALPADSLSTACISGEQNEANNCGFANNLRGLCGYCATSSPNSTDSCCSASNVTGRCPGVVLPVTTSIPPLFPSSTSTTTLSTTSATTASSTDAQRQGGLSGGAIAGIVIGSLVGALLVLGVLIFCCICLRRRQRGSQASIFNQPNPQRRGGPTMSYAPHNTPYGTTEEYEPKPGGRVARMSALENNSSDSRAYGDAALVGGSAVDLGKSFGDKSDSHGYDDSSPESHMNKAPPIAGKRNGSLSSQSALGALDDYSSPNTDAQNSSPDGIASGQSEQLPAFQDYYSPDEIHPNDKVAVLWDYQPRASDEFALLRGEMLKVVGIWDDAWATGVRVRDRAEDYGNQRPSHRDSGVAESPRHDMSTIGQLKAFPIVCVCLPEYFKQKTTEYAGMGSKFQHPMTGDPNPA